MAAPVIIPEADKLLRTTQLRALQDIVAGVGFSVNGGTATLTEEVGTPYTGHDVGTAATLPDKYGTDIWVYAPGMVEEDDVSRNDSDPAGYIRLSFTVLSGTVITIRSQTT